MAADADVLIVGGGPAGMMAGLLFARAGLDVLVLEKHADFLRDFRGDTVHPSTLRLFHELRLRDALLERPHDKVRNVAAHVGGRRVEVADFSRFDPRWAFLAIMPQWEFLDFVSDAAHRYPSFRLRRTSEADGLLMEDGRVGGVRCGDEAIRARLVILADGRGSRLRAEAGLEPRRLGAPMDVFWFCLPKRRTAANETAGYFDSGRIAILIDRGDYWQCAWLFAKGEEERIRRRGLDAFRRDVAAAAPPVAGAVEALRSWDEVRLLRVALDRLDQWHRPGLLVIGDAAHAMSPIGGIGINLAIQDAVAAANILAAPMAAGRDPGDLLGRVRRRRMPAVRAAQAFQRAAQRAIVAPLIDGAPPPARLPLPLRLLDRFAPLRRIPAAFIGFGVRPEQIRSPKA